MVRLFYTGLLILVSNVSFGQKAEGKLMYYIPQSYIQPGMLEGSETFSPSSMLNRASNNYYLSGFAAYTLDNKISIRSDNYFLMNSSEDDPFLDQAFRSYIGAFYHFRKDENSNWDKYVGFQPGVAYLKRNLYYGGKNTFAPNYEEGHLVPSFSVSVGTSFYVWKYFNFYANLAYVNSNLKAVSGGPFKTDELIFSAGLGFQIQTRKN